MAHQSIKPDSERVRSLLEMRAPITNKELQRLIGLFAYYARWILSYSDKILPLIKSTLPLSSDALFAFDVLKQALASAALHPIDSTLPLTVETDASNFAIAGTLNQKGRPIASHSKTLSPAEQRHSSVEKETYAVVKALRKWRYFLIGRHFTLVTDQKSVSFMFDRHHASKIKNEKIMRWRMDLSSFHFTILHWPGKKMIGPDTLSRAFCGTIGTSHLKELHVSLCHSGVTRMAHFVQSKNLSYSLLEIRQMTSECRECQKIKPQFVQSQGSCLIKSTQPFERLNLDFKGPLPSTTKNRYFLTIIDEYTRFPFAFPCSDITPFIVIN